LREELPDLFDDDLKEKIKHETIEAFISESKIIDWMIGDFRSDIVSPEIVKEFIKNRINDSLIQIGYEKIFDIDQELLSKTTWFDEEVLSKARTDFFHTRPIGYQKSSQSFDVDSLFD
jgi:ribonucleoside-diphosphate reductase beta chain